jgi:hypothetical protein
MTIGNNHVAPMQTRNALEYLRAQRDIPAPEMSQTTAAPEVPPEVPAKVEARPLDDRLHTSQHSSEAFRLQQEIQKAALAAKQAEERMNEAVRKQQELQAQMQNPMAYLKSQYPDMSQEDLNMFVLTGKLPTELEAKKMVKNEVEDVKQEIAKIRQELEMRERKAKADNMLNEFTTQHAANFPLVEELGGAKFVLAAAIQHHKNTGEYLTLPQMAEKIEQYELQKAQKLIQKAGQVGKYGISGNTAPRSDVTANTPRTLSGSTVPQSTNNLGQETQQELMIRLNKLLLGQ